MKQKRALFAIATLGLVILGCSSPDFQANAPLETPAAVKTLRPTFTPPPPATNTPLPTATPIPTDTPIPTSTPLPPTETPLPPTPVPPTPVPPTPTSEPPTPTQAPPTATRRPQQPTKAPPTAAPPPKARHVTGSHGVSGLVIARDKTTFSTGEKAYFTYEALNQTQDPVPFVLLGIKASNGQFNTSWVNPDVIQPGVPFRHDDGLTFTTPGTFKVMLAICFSRCGESDADWEEFPQGAATITVK